MGSVNGKGCQLYMDQLTLCKDDTVDGDDLHMYIIDLGEKQEEAGTKHEMKITGVAVGSPKFKNETALPSDVIANPKFVCTPGAQKRRVIAGDVVGKWSVLIKETEFKDRINVVDVEVVANVVTSGTLTASPDYDEIPRGNAVDNLNGDGTLGIRKDSFIYDPNLPPLFAGIVEFKGKLCKKPTELEKNAGFYFRQTAQSKYWVYSYGELVGGRLENVPDDRPSLRLQDNTADTKAQSIYSADSPGVSPDMDAVKGDVRMFRQQFKMWVVDEDEKVVSNVVEWQCDTTLVMTDAATWVRAGKNTVHQGFDTLDATQKEAEAARDAALPKK